MKRFPEADLPDYIPADFELILQNQQIFDNLHAQSEKSNTLYLIAHQAITIAAQPALDNERLLDSLTTGVTGYEIIGIVASDPDPYNTIKGQTLAFQAAREFVNDIRKDEDFLRKANYALERMEVDAPNLTATLEEVAGRYIGHGKTETQFALRGAAILRSIQIYTDRLIAA